MSRLDRQSFLGPESDAVLEAATIGIVGLGGGGSHVVQQTAHMGIGGYINVDPQTIDETNTNRLVGGTLADVYCRPAKPGIVKRLVRGLTAWLAERWTISIASVPRRALPRDSSVVSIPKHGSFPFVIVGRKVLIS